MQTRKVGPFDVSAIGLGCMSLSHAYGTPPDDATSERLLLAALDMGVTFLDTAALYGFGRNEELVGRTLKHRRGEYVLASKCGMFKGPDGKREINGRPEIIRQTCDDSLRRLQTEVIDLYYLHRWDKKVPIEDSVGALSELVQAGKIRTIGLSEVSASTIRKAHAVHPVTAVQNEYSLWTRNVEVGALDTCREIGATMVAFSPVARGFLTGKLRDTAGFPPGDIRLNMPRFQEPNFAANLKLLDGYAEVARDVGCTMAQLALAWLLAKDPIIVPIPGTTRIDHLEEDLGGAEVILSAESMARLEELINPATVVGPRYNAATQLEIDTEELPEVA
jgi:aryl-alcohol dehydrogenase-like predicted oxidoreductase